MQVVRLFYGLQAVYFLFTLSLRALPGLNLGHLLAEILIVSPVFGLRPERAALFPTASIKRDYDKVFEKLDNPAFLYVRRT